MVLWPIRARVLFELFYKWEIVNEFVDFQESIFNIVRKLVFHRKYHIKNTIFDIRKRNNIQISTNDEIKILETFKGLRVSYLRSNRNS